MQARIFGVMLMGISWPAFAGALPEPQALTLSCAAPFVRLASHETLVAHFGAKNISTEMVDGPEGSTNEVTVIFAKDPTRRLEAHWLDEKARKGLIVVEAKEPESLWTGPGGMRIGQTLEDVEKANGRPFTLTGFANHFWGWVGSWKGGAMEKAEKDATCGRFSVRFAETNDSEGVEGEDQYPSDLPAMRKARPTVVSFGVGHAFPNAPSLD